MGDQRLKIYEGQLKAEEEEREKKKEKAAAGRFLGVASGLKLSPLMLPSSQS